METKISNVSSHCCSVWTTVRIRPSQPQHKLVPLKLLFKVTAILLFSGWTKHLSSSPTCPYALYTFPDPLSPSFYCTPTDTLSLSLHTPWQSLLDTGRNSQSNFLVPGDAGTSDFWAAQAYRKNYGCRSAQALVICECNAAQKFSFACTESSRKQRPCKRKHSPRRSGNRVQKHCFSSLVLSVKRYSFSGAHDLWTTMLSLPA